MHENRIVHYIVKYSILFSEHNDKTAIFPPTFDGWPFLPGVSIVSAVTSPT